eukprot:TRINITY_DN8472_c0_g1_i18.p1 TRINITY_DN8472_c0_g1~~TRINITY_DN8472_c0_g1_i18.p1  ORF type:complete len:437 (+),score=114.92 TRINITY_DN8472_c0_g1_i18:49-1311(+)
MCIRDRYMGIDDHMKHNVIIYGPSGCGKSQLARFLNKEHLRGIINMDELLDWNINQKTEAAKVATDYLDGKAKELETAKADLEKKKNEQTYEFVFFKINMNIAAPDIIGKVDLSSVVRETSSAIVTLENPLKNPVEFKKEQITCDNDNVTINPTNFVIAPKSEFGLEIIYRPLLVVETNNKLTIKSPELGEFIYSLHLSGLPTNAQRSMTFKAALGGDIVQQFKFTNYVKKPTAYTCRVEKLGGVKSQTPITTTKPGDKGAPAALTDFSTEPATITAPASDSYEGVEVGVNVKFEPSNLNDSRALLVISSPEGGEYQCLLYGQAFAPQPKGPFKIGSAKSPPIDFKNPFFEAADFTIRIDNPCFTSSAKSPSKIDPKKTLSISITYKAAPNMPNTGRMMISTGDYPPWIFYLQGEQTASL